MRINLYNISQSLAKEIQMAIKLWQHSESKELPEEIVLFQTKDDSEATRVNIRKLLVNKNAPVFVLSDSGELAKLLWRIDDAYYINTSDGLIVEEFVSGFKSFLNRNSATYTQKIAIPSQRKIDFIHPNEVSFLKADRNYTEIYLTNGKKLTVSKNLSEVEKLFLDYDFIERFGKSHILNLNRIVAIQGKNIEFKNGSIIAFPKYSNSINYLKERLIWKKPKNLKPWKLSLEDK